MSKLNNRLQKLEAHSSPPKVHYTWVEPGLTEEQLCEHEQRVRSDCNLPDETTVVAFWWMAPSEGEAVLSDTLRYRRGGYGSGGPEIRSAINKSDLLMSDSTPITTPSMTE